ncbi:MULTISPECIES: tRNA lysidine(34) synthetase TilS [Actinoalloteichus]|uniref:tRNA(Ile)-lysidine synthase n=1 Tax=Actinoalloteichus fjordicus TaxID=1612552 RepID=A0AAC9PPT9_9PSEU|nr:MULTISPECIES: tRNA lysidine(34) synthetase TilS [Actinoalloteichus]APU12395.1 tRNA(Ile)-lysidine synthetase [Actinoalloteichus fjordicus]APU18347.1 tRNA(Ile)-lysidine synthetase [Actinoalloteichus sp. GBA129-24]
MTAGTPEPTDSPQAAAVESGPAAATPDPAAAGSAGPPRPGAALDEVRAAVRRLLDRAPEQARLAGVLGVACSGGADSLALAGATVQAARRFGLAVHGLVVDHRLQPDSASVAATAAEQLAALGCAEVSVLDVTVSGAGGPEAAARRARYAALSEARTHPDQLVLLGHTRDDQAETVLLGLGRGSGPRSIAGMRPLDPPWARPLLDCARATTLAACADLGVRPWEDPHNTEARFTRVRLRHEVLPLLEEVLHGGVAGALARTAEQVRDDLAALDDWAERALTQARDECHVDWLTVDSLDPLPAAVRTRVLRSWLRGLGVRDLSAGQLRAVDELVSRWRGQGGVWLPGGLVAARAHGRLALRTPDRRHGGDRLPPPAEPHGPSAAPLE